MHSLLLGDLSRLIVLAMVKDFHNTGKLGWIIVELLEQRVGLMISVSSQDLQVFEFLGVPLRFQGLID